MATILVVDADSQAAHALRDDLARVGHVVVTAGTVAAASRLVGQRRPDLILVDPALPDARGFESCRILRAETNVPMVILAVGDEEVDKVVGLELGADDYMTKPYSSKELLARVGAHLRRSHRAAATPSQALVCEDLRVDFGERRVTRDGTELALRPREFDLLVFLMQNRGRTVARHELLSRIWGYPPFGKTRTVDVHVDRLRGKIEDEPAQPRRIVTVRGVGYRFEG